MAFPVQLGDYGCGDQGWIFGPVAWRLRLIAHDGASLGNVAPLDYLALSPLRRSFSRISFSRPAVLARAHLVTVSS